MKVVDDVSLPRAEQWVVNEQLFRFLNQPFNLKMIRKNCSLCTRKPLCRFCVRLLIFALFLRLGLLHSSLCSPPEAVTLLWGRFICSGRPSAYWSLLMPQWSPPRVIGETPVGPLAYWLVRIARDCVQAWLRVHIRPFMLVRVEECVGTVPLSLFLIYNHPLISGAVN